MNKRVLIVDDDLAIRNLFRRALEQKGFRVSTAGDGDEGIFRAISEKPDVILMDVELPEIDGIAITCWLRRNPFTRSIPVVMMSGFATLPIVAAARDASASDFIVKADVTIGVLMHRIARAAAIPAPMIDPEERPAASRLNIRAALQVAKCGPSNQSAALKKGA